MPSLSGTSLLDPVTGKRLLSRSTGKAILSTGTSDCARGPCPMYVWQAHFECPIGFWVWFLGKYDNLTAQPWAKGPNPTIPGATSPFDWYCVTAENVRPDPPDVPVISPACDEAMPQCVKVSFAGVTFDLSAITGACPMIGYSGSGELPASPGATIRHCSEGCYDYAGELAADWLTDPGDMPTKIGIYVIVGKSGTTPVNFFDPGIPGQRYVGVMAYVCPNDYLGCYTGVTRTLFWGVALIDDCAELNDGVTANNYFTSDNYHASCSDAAAYGGTATVTSASCPSLWYWQENYDCVRRVWTVIAASDPWEGVWAESWQGINPRWCVTSTSTPPAPSTDTPPCVTWKWFASVNCNTGAWVIFLIGRDVHDPAEWGPPPTASGTGGGVVGGGRPGQTPVERWHSCYRVCYTLTNDQPDPPALPDDCCAPCECPAEVHTSYGVDIPAGQITYGTAPYGPNDVQAIRWPAVSGVIVDSSSSACAFDGDASALGLVAEQYTQANGWTGMPVEPGTFAPIAILGVILGLNTTAPCGWVAGLVIGFYGAINVAHNRSARTPDEDGWNIPGVHIG